MISAACTTPPAAMTRAWPKALSADVGRVITTSMTATVSDETMPAVGPSAQAMPARKAQTASSATNTHQCAPAR